MKKAAAMRGKRYHHEAGQAAIVVTSALMFLLLVVGLGVDYSNVYFHRQAAQAAADAACQAGAMDMYALAQGQAVGGTFQPGFTPSIADCTKTPLPDGCYDCSQTPSAIPCKYAALNGYSGVGLSDATHPNRVTFDFSNSITGVTAPPTILTSVPFMRVTVTDGVQMYFSSLISGLRTQNVRAVAKCGLVLEKAPIPLVLLHPSMPSALGGNGTGNLTILGGPSQSIQVNSSDLANAVQLKGSGLIDLRAGGLNFDGSDLGVVGGPTSVPSYFRTANDGGWRQPSTAIRDPYELLAVPDPTKLVAQTGPYLTKTTGNGCPDPAGCDEYAGGYYDGGIKVKNVTAIFDPGIYYLNGGLKLDTGSVVRPSTAVGDGTGGTMFYLTGTAPKCSGQTGLVCVGSDSGKAGLTGFSTSRLTCPGGTPPVTYIQNLFNGLTPPDTLPGNVFLAPCSGTYGGDASGLTRGILFFGDRNLPDGGGWGGGGGYLLAGTIYIHQCNSPDGVGLGTNCPNSAYGGGNGGFTLSGNAGSDSWVMGEIVTDNLTMSGTPNVNMALNPNATHDILKVALLQ